MAVTPFRATAPRRSGIRRGIGNEVGLGVDELSIAPAHVDAIRVTVRSLYAQTAAAVAHSALTAASARQALELGREALLDELGDEDREVVDGLGGVVA